MAVRNRIQKYRTSGGAADLVRVEVLVPPEKRDEILSQAANMREQYRQKKLRLEQSVFQALQAYKSRISDNIDLDKIPDIFEKSRIVANALMERGDARAFVLGRYMLKELES